MKIGKFENASGTNANALPLLGSLHDVRRVVSLKETKQAHSQESDPPADAQGKI